MYSNISLPLNYKSKGTILKEKLAYLSVMRHDSRLEFRTDSLKV